MPSQKEYDKTFLNIAHEISKLSKCVSHQVGAVIVRDGRILSTGYNGTPPGFVNCCDLFKKPHVYGPPQEWADREAHHAWSNRHEIHAEENCTLFAAKNGIELNGATLYCTLEPCFNCAKNMIAAGIKRIVYGKYYDKAPDREETRAFLEQCGVIIEKGEMSWN